MSDSTDSKWPKAARATIALIALLAAIGGVAWLVYAAMPHDQSQPAAAYAPKGRAVRSVLPTASVTATEDASLDSSASDEATGIVPASDVSTAVASVIPAAAEKLPQPVAGGDSALSHEPATAPPTPSSPSSPSPPPAPPSPPPVVTPPWSPPPPVPPPVVIVHGHHGNQKKQSQTNR